MRVPKVVVLILSYNGKHLLKEAISSYLGNDYSRFEVIVIDNGSIDGTLEYMRKNFPKVEVVRTENNLGYSGGLNLGLNYAFNKINANYVLITNNDVRADGSVISELVKVAVMDGKIGFVTGKVYYYDKPNILQTVGKKEDPIKWNGGHIGNGDVDKGQYDDVCERVFADDIYVLVSSALYRDTGGYDTTFFIQSEDYDWQARAKKLDYRIVYTPYAKLWHKDSMTIGKDSALKAYYDARNPMLVVLRHKSTVFFKRYVRFHFLHNVVRSSLIYLKQGRLSLSAARWYGFLSGIAWGLKNRMLTIRHFL